MLHEIIRTIERHSRRVEVEEVVLLDAVGRIAARTLKTRRNAPPFDISALDGYAVKGDGPHFRVAAELEPASASRVRIREGEAIFVPTGAPIPPGTRFLPREAVTEQGPAITAHGEADGRKIWQKGLWLPKGATLVEQGLANTPQAIERLAMAGYAALPVFRKPRVAVLATGNELVRGTSTDSNRYLLGALATRDGADVSGLAVAPDDVPEIAALIAKLSGTADLLLITGGTAKGKKDLTSAALRSAGARVLLKDLPISPGKTMIFAKREGMPIFSLPGNPRPLLALYTVFVRPCLFRLAGRRTLSSGWERLALPETLEVGEGSARIIPARLLRGGPAISALYVDSPDGFVIVEGQTKALRKGDHVEVVWQDVHQ